MKICASDAAAEVVVRDQPISFSIGSMIRLSEERAEKDTASARKQKPTMIQAPRSGSCCGRAAVMDCLCQGGAAAIILGGAGSRACGERRGWHALDAVLRAQG